MLESRRRGRLLAICVALLLCASERLASAHDPFEVTTAATLDATSMTLVVTMTRSSAARVAGLEQDARTFAPELFDQDEPRLLAAAGRLYRVTSNGEALLPREARVQLNPEDEIAFYVTYPRPPPGSLQLHATCLSLLSEGHGNAVRIAQGQPETVLALEFLHASRPALEVHLPVEPFRPAIDSSRESTAAIASFVELGFRHILTGYDHLLFLAGLLLGCRRLSGMLGSVTCFTLAHSLTLALAVLDAVPALVGAWVEPLICASIVCVGVQNFVLQREPQHRYALTFGFGLFHGLGFAGALSELGLPRQAAAMTAALFGFNIGVELGQMLLAALALPLLLGLRKAPRGVIVIRGLALAITSLGVYWLVTLTLLRPP